MRSKPKTREQKLHELSEQLKPQKRTRKKSGESCPVCGLSYDNFRTGDTYQTIYEILWVNDPDYKKWRYKGISGILGKWKEIKEKLWLGHLKECAQYEEWLLSGGEEIDERMAIEREGYDKPSDDEDDETPF